MVVSVLFFFLLKEKEEPRKRTAWASYRLAYYAYRDAFRASPICSVLLAIARPAEVSLCVAVKLSILRISILRIDLLRILNYCYLEDTCNL